MHDDAQADKPPPSVADPERFARACASSCPFTWCTGKGSTDYRAHRCSHRPELVPELGPCTIDGCGKPSSFVGMNGRRCPEHAPAQPKRGEPTRPSPPPLPPRVYGSASCSDDKCKVPLCVSRRG